MEQIYTIPVNEAFEKVGEHPECGCPFCKLYKKLEEDELEPHKMVLLMYVLEDEIEGLEDVDMEDDDEVEVIVMETIYDVPAIEVADELTLVVSDEMLQIVDEVEVELEEKVPMPLVLDVDDVE